MLNLFFHNCIKSIDSLIKVLNPIHITTTVLCAEKHFPISMIRPIIKKIIKKHLLHSDDDDDTII